jgi:hypothetical protein
MKIRFHFLILLLLLFVTGLVSKKIDKNIGMILGLLIFVYMIFIVIKIIKRLKNKTIEIKNDINQKFEKDQEAISKLRDEFELKVVDVDKIEEIIRKHEKKIIEQDKKYLQDLIRLNNYIKELIQIINDKVLVIEREPYFIVSNFRKFIQETKQLNSNINDLYVINFLMIECLIKEDLTGYHQIYEKLDKLSVFDSNFEKQLNNNLTKISLQLRGIQNSLNVTNVLMTYNTIQLNKIKEKTNKL